MVDTDDKSDAVKITIHNGDFQDQSCWLDLLKGSLSFAPRV